MTAYLQLDLNATDQAAAEAITRHFGTGTTVLGITGMGGLHPAIHRAELATPFQPHCGTSSHGQPNPIHTVVAVTDRPHAEAVIELLQLAGYQPCRMCRRCWRHHGLPAHERSCFHTT